MLRYARAGPLYDLVSLEPLLYRRPRRRLLELLGPMPGAVVVDLGCGTGLNLAGLHQLVTPDGTVIGIDDSRSMLDAAHRRVRQSGWDGVLMLEGDAADLRAVVAAAGVDLDAVDAVVVTFVLSLLPDDVPVWSAIDALAARRPLRVAVADVGPPVGAPAPLRPPLRLLAKLGGGDPDRRPWERLADRASDIEHEILLGGHVHVAVGTCGR